MKTLHVKYILKCLVIFLFALGWTDAKLDTFIDAYHNQIVLWDANHVDHKDRNKIHDAWTNLEDVMNMPRAVLQAKVRQLKFSFNRSNQTKSGQARKKSKFSGKLAEKLSFMVQSAKPSSTVSAGISKVSQIKHKKSFTISFILGIFILPGYFSLIHKVVSKPIPFGFVFISSTL